MGKSLPIAALRILVAALVLGAYPLSCGLGGYCIGYFHATQRWLDPPESLQTFIPWQPETYE